MNLHHKPCQQCSRTMAADDAHLRCQKCRMADLSKLTYLSRKHRRRWYYNDWQRANRAQEGRA